MLEKKVTILLIGLMCFGSISGFFTVICHGSDGHVAVEPVVHNHCQCPETGDEDKHGNIAITASDDHGHCRDSIASPDVIIPTRKNVRLSTHKVFTNNLALNPISTSPPSVFSRFTARGDDLSSFYSPLRTVVLLV